MHLKYIFNSILMIFGGNGSSNFRSLKVAKQLLIYKGRNNNTKFLSFLSRFLNKRLDTITPEIYFNKLKSKFKQNKTQGASHPTSSGKFGATIGVLS